tara:strand:+ start:2767 stop:3018 length:252 start_codon:yes stop_codon:yes gene_type:complete
MLSKQSIRKEMTIYLNGEVLEKDDMIEISKEFNEQEELHFRKMMRQGGSIKIQGNKYLIKRKEYQFRNSKGEFEKPIINKTSD